MDFKGYFEKELVDLHRLADEAAAKNPALRAALSAPGGRDPDVERLMESFAFLGARLRQKLDDFTPEITHGLLGLLWPNYLRPFPASSILQYQPASNLTGSEIIPKGSSIDSTPVDGTPCTFQTVYDTEVFPLRIVDLRFFTRDGKPHMAVRFSVLSGTLATLPLKSLRLFLVGEKNITASLYYALCHDTERFRFVACGVDGAETVTAYLERQNIEAVGFKRDEGLYPYPENLPLGQRVLQEYFLFPEKFSFVDIKGLKKGIAGALAKKVEECEVFELQFILKSLPDIHEQVTVENIRLFCTPVVNLFPVSPPQKTILNLREPYKLIPDPNRPDHFSVHSVCKVTAIDPEGKGSKEYGDWLHSLDFSRASASYKIIAIPSLVDEEADVFIAFEQESAKKLQIQFDLLCTNAALPSRLHLGDIHSPQNDSGAVSCSNITPVQPSIWPPIDDERPWKLLSAMTLSPVILTDAVALRAVLRTFDFRSSHDSRAAVAINEMLRGITCIKTRATDRIWRGVPVRGLQTKISLNSACFYCEGSLYLFSRVLDSFLSQFSTHSSFHHLNAVSTTGNDYNWPMHMGEAYCTQ